MDTVKKMDNFIMFKPHQSTTLQIWIISKKLYFKSSLLLNGLCGIQVRCNQHFSSDDLCLSSVFILLLWEITTEQYLELRAI